MTEEERTRAVEAMERLRVEHERAKARMTVEQARALQKGWERLEAALQEKLNLSD